MHTLAVIHTLQFAEMNMVYFPLFECNVSLLDIICSRGRVLTKWKYRRLGGTQISKVLLHVQRNRTQPNMQSPRLLELLVSSAHPKKTRRTKSTFRPNSRPSLATCAKKHGESSAKVAKQQFLSAGSCAGVLASCYCLPVAPFPAI